MERAEEPVGICAETRAAGATSATRSAARAIKRGKLLVIKIVGLLVKKARANPEAATFFPKRVAPASRNSNARAINKVPLFKSDSAGRAFMRGHELKPQVAEVITRFRGVSNKYPL